GTATSPAIATERHPMDAPALPRNDSAESAFERRSARARVLAPRSSAARAVLCFAAELYRAHGLVAAVIERAGAERPLSAPAAPPALLLRVAVDLGPPGLSDAARGRRAASRLALLGGFWRNGGSGRNDYLSRALLRPYAAALIAMRAQPERPAAEGPCPLCKG